MQNQRLRQQAGLFTMDMKYFEQEHEQVKTTVNGMILIYLIFRTRTFKGYLFTISERRISSRTRNFI